MSRDPRDRVNPPRYLVPEEGTAIDPFGAPPAEPEAPVPDPCPRCEPVEGLSAPQGSRGVACPTCGRYLNLPTGLPDGTVLTMLLSLRLLGEPIMKAWETTRDIIDDEGLRTHLLAPLEDEPPDVRISLNTAEVPDPISPAVRTVIEKEQAFGKMGLRRLLYALKKRQVMLRVIFKETYGAGFQRDEARVAARLGFRLGVVQLALRDKVLIRV